MSASTATPGSQGHVFTPLINEQYRITKRLGGGSFGDIYLGVGQNGEQVAVKFEKHSTRCPQLRHEYKVYRELQNCPGFGRVYYYGTHNSYNAMVMDLLGPSLEDLFTKCGRRFSLKTVLQIADQLLERMETMHSRHLIHRDVKPANFVLGPGRGCSTIFCIDFGLSTRYRHPRTLQHIPYRDGRSLTGTPRYASINNHLGLEQSRRDDLESIGFVLVYFLKGSLPWQGLKARNAKRKYKIIMERKQAISIQQLCQGLPQQFAEYLAYCRSLKFEAKPNVPYLQGLLRELYQLQGHSSPGPTEWDWSKYEVRPSSGGTDSGARDAVISGDGDKMTPIVTAVELTQGTIPWQAIPVDGNTSTRINVPMVGVKSQIRDGGAEGVGSGDHPGFCGLPAARWTAFGDDKKRTSDDANCSELELGKALEAGEKGSQGAIVASKVNAGAPGHVCRAGHGSGRSTTPNWRGQGATEGSAGWSMWNLRPKSSGSFWGRGLQGAQSGSVIGPRLGRNPHERQAIVEAARGEGEFKTPDHHWGIKTIQHDATKTARPHTAHGPRGSITSKERALGHGGWGEASPVVAGARGVMRYRNERTPPGAGGSSGFGSDADIDPSSAGHVGAGHAWSCGDGAMRCQDTVPVTTRRGGSNGTSTGTRLATGRKTDTTYLRGRSSFIPGGRNGGPLRGARDPKRTLAGGPTGAERHHPLSARSRSLIAATPVFVHPPK